MLIISWNITGQTKRFEEVKLLLEEYAPDILCLQKVKSSSGRDRFEIDGYRQLFAPQDYGSSPAFHPWITSTESDFALRS